MFIYEQRTGRLRRSDGAADRVIATGYSGWDPGKNVPLAQHIPNVGPIPQGAYLIESPRDTITHGPFVLPLLPYGATNTYGRNGFLVHGDSKEHPGQASHGCIILPRAIREAIAQDASKLLVVLSGNSLEVA